MNSVLNSVVSNAANPSSNFDIGKEHGRDNRGQLDGRSLGITSCTPECITGKLDDEPQKLISLDQRKCDHHGETPLHIADRQRSTDYLQMLNKDKGDISNVMTPVTTQPQQKTDQSSGYGCDYGQLKQYARASGWIGLLGAVTGYCLALGPSNCQPVPALIGVPIGGISLPCAAMSVIAIVDRCSCIRRPLERQISTFTEQVTLNGGQQHNSELPLLSPCVATDSINPAPPSCPENGSCIPTAPPPAFSEIFSSCSAPVRSQPRLQSSSALPSVDRPQHIDPNNHATSQIVSESLPEVASGAFRLTSGGSTSLGNPINASL